MTTGTVLLLGATGTIGQATLAELCSAGYRVIAPFRGAQPPSERTGVIWWARAPEGVFREEQVDAVVSCIASRTGLDAWEVDYGVNSRVLKAAVAAGVGRYVLLSAICVQKPRLDFQHAKLAFEAELQAAPLSWSIVRPTAFFKSISGQMDRLRRGKPYLLFGDGALTACKPISDRDTARYLVSCLQNDALLGKVLPVGGPGPALTPREQGALMFEALGRPPRFKHVPVGVIRGIAGLLGPLGRVSVTCREKAELARIGHYYATESMLVWDAAKQRYDAEATPEFGTDRLADHFRALSASGESDVRREHAVF